MTYLLDTNVVSELRRPKQMAPEFRAWLSSVAFPELWISSIVLLELEYGAANAAYKQLPHAPLLRTWIDTFVVPEFLDRTLPVDRTVAATCAPFHVPRTRPTYDALTAATAIVHRKILVTRDVGHFAGFGVRLLDPWDHA